MARIPQKYLNLMKHFCSSRTGVLLGTAAIFQLGRPWMDKRRLEKEALLEAKLEEGSEGELLTA